MVYSPVQTRIGSSNETFCKSVGTFQPPTIGNFQTGEGFPSTHRQATARSSRWATRDKPPTAHPCATSAVAESGSCGRDNPVRICFFISVGFLKLAILPFIFIYLFVSFHLLSTLFSLPSETNSDKFPCISIATPSPLSYSAFRSGKNNAVDVFTHAMFGQLVRKLWESAIDRISV